MGIVVGNIKNGDRGIYIGRGMKGRSGSVLGNRFKVGKFGREGSIGEYRRWLWEKIKVEDEKVMGELRRIKSLVERGEDVVLVCWCKPLPCHGDVVKSCVEWMIREGR